MNDAQSGLPFSPDRGSQSASGKRFNFWRWFWLSFLVVSLGYAWHCFYVPGNTIAWADSHASAQQQAAQSGKPMLLFFSGTWCVPCRIMKREVWADREVTAAVNSGYVPVTLDVGDPAAAEAVNRYGVRGTPSTVVVDAQGEVVRKVDGGMAKTAFLELLRTGNATGTSDG